jgi:hypothetical protein
MQDSRRVSVQKVDDRQASTVEDDLVTEEPLEIRVNGQSFSVTMRTPGNDFDLARGLLWTEGIITSEAEIGTIAYCPDEQQPDLKNILNVMLVDTSRTLESSRRLWSNSSCGLCGKATLDSIHQVCQPITSSITIDRDIVYSLPSRLREAQANFERTGGIHAVGVFDPRSCTPGRIAFGEADSAGQRAARFRDCSKSASGWRSHCGLHFRALEPGCRVSEGIRHDHDRVSSRTFDECLLTSVADSIKALRRLCQKSRAPRSTGDPSQHPIMEEHGRPLVSVVLGRCTS